MNNKIKDLFCDDIETTNPHIIYPCFKMDKFQYKTIETIVDNSEKACDFAKEINENIVGDFEKEGIDKMCHVSTFCYINDKIYVSYYANTQDGRDNHFFNSNTIL